MNDFVDSINVPAAVDIIIPYYRAFDYLCEAVESVCAQTFTNFRLLVIDDSPNDLIAREFIESLKDPRISYVSNPRNLGLNKTLEIAKTLSNAKWTIFLGHDDRLLPGYLERLLAVSQKYPTAALIQSKTQVIDSNGLIFRPLPDKTKDLIWRASTLQLTRGGNAKHDPVTTLINWKIAINMIAIGDFLYFPLIMWKRDFLLQAPFRMDLLVTSDIEILFQIFLLKGDLLLVDEELGQYRRHHKSLSENPEAKLSRLIEESATYNEMSSLFKVRKLMLARILSRIRISTRLYIFYECAKCLVFRDFKRAGKFFLLGSH